ncbi:MAG: hypothetical protein ONB11_12045 [candidate division KSB1 bacterium]|nr:hypothetical protein [candidate division KSB1 bacterium]
MNTDLYYFLMPGRIGRKNESGDTKRITVEVDPDIIPRLMQKVETLLNKANKRAGSTITISKIVRAALFVLDNELTGSDSKHM